MSGADVYGVPLAEDQLQAGQATRGWQDLRLPLREQGKGLTAAQRQ